jgi:hypothetical protein
MHAAEQTSPRYPIHPPFRTIPGTLPTAPSADGTTHGRLVALKVLNGNLTASLGLESIDWRSCPANRTS